MWYPGYPTSATCGPDPQSVVGISLPSPAEWTNVEITLLRHVAGDYDEVLGQLCMRCGMVLDSGLSWKASAPGTTTPRGWPAGQAVMASVGGGFRCLEAFMRADRDRSDEADCRSVVDG